MAAERSRYGLLVSAFGALVVIASVFLPWYEVAFTLHTSASAAAGHRLGELSGPRALRELNIVLLVLAALAILDALAPLAHSSGQLPGGAGRSVVLLGAAAGAFVLYRMIVPPAQILGVAELSLREGAWLALLGSATIALGGIWPRGIGFGAPSTAQAPDAWRGLQS